MSIVGTLFTGRSGLSAHGDAISVVGDNIANANTVGFKGSRANFEDILARSVGAGPGDIGLGVRVAKIQTMLGQGALLGTGVATDLAVKGNGFFVVRGAADGLSGNFFTRAGQFHLNSDGQLVNDAGLIVQGYGVDANNTIVKTVTDLTVPTSQVPPKSTTSATVVGNLDSDESEPANPFSTTDPTGTSNFSTSVTVYDSLGKGHTVNVYFRKEAAAGTWSYHALVDGGELTGGTAGVFEEEASGTLVFDTQGRLTTNTATASDFDFLGAVQSQAITFDFGDATGAGGTGLQGMTNFSSASAISFLDQDGYSSGALSGISIDSDGTVNGVFSNGTQQTVGKVLLADFANAEGLRRMGGNLWLDSTESGAALISEAAQGGRGTINAGSLEQSNVDLAKEFVDMIALQRGFQANSRTIQTADQMLMEVLSLKR